MTTKQELDNRGCCEGIAKLTPQDLANPPGLAALSYRVGTHGSFKTTMLAGLAGSGGVPGLTTRADDDPAIALMDATAVMLSVLTFYQERIANEGYLRTATERMSVLELARAIGYELKPGVAAGTYLAFEMETAAGAPASAEIAVGTKVQSLPGQDEKPQTFETVERLEARTAWNQLRPQTLRPAWPAFGDTVLYLQGTVTNLKIGDALLIIGDERKNDPGRENWDFRRVTGVTPVPAADAAAGYTVVDLDQGLGSYVPHVEPAKKNPRVYALRQRANLFGFNAPDWRGMPKSIKASYLHMTEGDLEEDTDLLLSPEWPDFTIAAISDPPTDAATGTGLYGEYFDSLNFKNRQLIRTDATIQFDWGIGSPAPGILGADTFSVRWTGWLQPKVTGSHTLYTRSDDGVRLWVDGKLVINNWTDHAAKEDTGTIRLEAGKKVDLKLEYYENMGAAAISLSWSAPGLDKEVIPVSQLYPRDIYDIHLDAVYSQLVKGGWVVLSVPDYQEVYSIESAAEDSRADFTLSAKTTRLTLKGENLREKFNERLRATVLFGQSEELLLASQPIPDPVEGDVVTLASLVSGLEEKRTLIFSGKRQRVTVLKSVDLVAADGVSRVTLKVGDSLLLEETPALLPTGGQVWKLTDKNGFSGSVNFASGAVAGQTLKRIASASADTAVSECAVIKAVTQNSDPTEIVLMEPLLRSYDRPTVTIYGNVAAATHGETHREVLGSGDAARTFQKFTLRQKPLTCVSAPTATGAQSTLEVRVNDVRWEEATSLYNLSARGRTYMTRRDDDGNVQIAFGDGVNGARLSTGSENVVATYRTGIGVDGMVKAGQLSLLLTRPLGVQKVTNPLAPTGAADPEPRDQARRNAPFTVLTLDRIVSLRDFEDFARAFAGIGKAQATWLWDGELRMVHLTIAAATSNGADYSVDSQSALFKNLRLAMDGARDTVQRLEIASYEPIFFRLKGRVLIDPAYLPEKVLAAVKTALQKAYGFEQRNFGQPVHKSEVLAVMQAVEGVKAVFLDQLYLRGKTAELQTPLLSDRAVREEAPAGRQGAIKAAQLLLLDALGIDVTEEVKT
jgi:hypothetical protein